MRSIVICPWTETIKEAEHNGDYRDIYRLLSHGRHKVETFTVAATFHNRDILYVDDNGLITDLILPRFAVAWVPQALAGRGVLIGSNEIGKSISAKTSLANVKKMVWWIDPTTD